MIVFFVVDNWSPALVPAALCVIVFRFYKFARKGVNSVVFLLLSVQVKPKLLQVTRNLNRQK